MAGWRRGLALAVAVALAASLAPSFRVMLRPGALVDENARHTPAVGSAAGTMPGDERTDP
ncbi:hypothetical protein D3C83_78140 [compost metagenome]